MFTNRSKMENENYLRQSRNKQMTNPREVKAFLCLLQTRLNHMPDFRGQRKEVDRSKDFLEIPQLSIPFTLYCEQSTATMT